MRTLYSYGFKLIKESGTFYFTYTLPNASILMRFQIRPDGIEEQLRWDEGTSKWSIVQLQPSNDCEVYNRCGAYGICNVMEKPICSCLIKGFVPKYESEWEGENCLKNCSCHAYVFVSGINCMVRSRDLIDMQRFVDGGNDLYIRVARSELETSQFRRFVRFVWFFGVVVLRILDWAWARARARASGADAIEWWTFIAPERLPWDRKDFFKERKQQQHERPSLDASPRWLLRSVGISRVSQQTSR
ncbi:hypothetical protein RHGRI_007744 [Rhododendron griersonianum]|uniref:S-locus glycoprotein domain-containing protein n=1 Tax=Rhododendron griersonianum TaxID=479676 RepID=A0AAV6KZA1_9ERIC|nr:hypothetical protein RHGRI_007744 [Rhododendron griersonianum]